MALIFYIQSIIVFWKSIKGKLNNGKKSSTVWLGWLVGGNSNKDEEGEGEKSFELKSGDRAEVSEFSSQQVSAFQKSNDKL